MASRIVALASLAVLTPAAQAGFADWFGAASLTNGARFAFVPSSIEAKILAIDAVTNEVSDVLTLPHISGPIAVSEKLDLLVATNPDEERVTLIYLGSKEIVRDLAIGMRPDAALFNPYDRFIAFGSRDGSVSVWDLEKFEQMMRIDGLGTGIHLTFSIDGRNLFVVDKPHKRISVIEMYERRKVGEIELGGPDVQDAEISAISRSADGARGYLSITSENRVLVLDLIDWKVLQTLPVSKAPIRPYSTADSRFVLIPHRDDRSLTVLSAVSHQVLATIPTKVAARAIHTGWLDTVAFIIPEDGDQVAVVDLQELRYDGAITLPGTPDEGLVTSDSKVLIAALASSGQIAAVDAKSRKLSAVIDTPMRQLAGIEIAVSNNICH